MFSPRTTTYLHWVVPHSSAQNVSQATAREEGDCLQPEAKPATQALDGGKHSLLPISHGDTVLSTLLGKGAPAQTQEIRDRGPC